ncbi:MAG: competence/damage-inducible protein A [Deltaproteobacteria bacterium]|nr:competence/damage-inducible protein A [Deltaproteobacteria bacterium]
MRGEIIATGTELVTGRTADQNARYAARRLHEVSLPVAAITIVGDDVAMLREVLALALTRSRFVLVTGGLGPTEDDMTLPAAAAEFHLKLVQDQGTLQRLKEFLKKRGRSWNERYGRLALIPEGATLLDPGRGACGFSLKHQDTWFFFLPGVPHEMHSLFDNVVLPALIDLAGAGEIVTQRTLRFFGITEVELQNVVSELEAAPGVAIGYYPSFPETHLTLTARGEDQKKLDAVLDRLTRALSLKVGEVLLGPEEGTLEELVGLRLKETGFRLAVAESCTGGLICHRVTNVPGASDYFMGGVVTYSNQAKIDLLKVPEGLLHARGAVSAETAQAMALGVREVFRADIGLSVTGIAGPTGGTPEKPVGTVYIGLATPQGVEARHHLFHGGREQIKTLTAQTALNWLRQELHHAQGLSRH